MLFTSNISTTVTILVSLIIGLSIHEATHAYISLKLGDTTAAQQGRVSFNPFRHISPFGTVLLPLITIVLFGVPILAARPVPFNPHHVKYREFGAAIMAAAGPLSNLILALIVAIVVRLISSQSGVVNIMDVFIAVNAGIFVFNMIPIPPLDGSRVLYAFAPEVLQQVMAQIEPYGFFLVFGLVLLVPGFSNLLITIDSKLMHVLLGF